MNHPTASPTGPGLSASQLMRRLLAKAPLVFATLLTLTGALLAWQHYGMERVYEISARSGHSYVSSSDSEAGGTSSSSILPEGDVLRLKCQLVAHAKWPYCKVQFALGVDTRGVDLSRYDYLTLDASFPGSGERRVRLFLIDYEHGFSKPLEWQTNKVNEVDAFDLPRKGVIQIPLDLFHTATWWKDQAKPPIQRTNVRIDNVTYLEVQTGPDNPLGPQDLSLRSIRFHGKAISLADLLLGIVVMWILVAVAWPATMYILLKTELTDSKAEVRLLNEVNRALRLETQELADQAHTDALTGALNRQGLRAHLMQSSSASATPMALIFADLDHFKSVNDVHGHPIGDMVLQQFSSTVAGLIRSQDKLVRWGGEEFLLLCPMTGLAQAAALAEKLRVVVQEATWPNGLQLSASFGVAERASSEEIGAVIERADSALYAAKAAGRNRVHAAAI